jgi:hypothetical protein
LLVDVRSPDVAANEWVSHHLKELPKVFDDYAAFPVDYQRAIFNALSPDDRSAIIDERWTRLLNEGNLNDEQRALIERARDVVTADTYEGDRASLERLSQVCQEATHVFTDGQRGLLQPIVTPSVLGWKTPIAAFRPRINTALHDYLIADAQESCGCHTGEFFCSHCTLEAEACIPSEGTCTRTSFGCGCAFAQSCDGFCSGGSS